jgi:hypothetical protein
MGINFEQLEKLIEKGKLLHKKARRKRKAKN